MFSNINLYNFVIDITIYKKYYINSPCKETLLFHNVKLNIKI